MVGRHVVRRHGDALSAAAEARLNRTFAALTDPTRRAILARLEREPGLSVSELARPLDLKLPGFLKHLDVLSEAGLVSRKKTGRTVAISLTPGPMAQARDWLARYERFWSAGLDRLTAYAEAEEDKARRSGK